MDSQQSPSLGPSAAWQDGYDAAVRDAIALIDALWLPGTGSFSSPVFLRLRSRLLQLAGDASKKAA